MKQLGVLVFPPWMGCYSIRVHTSSSSWNFSNFPGVFKGKTKKSRAPINFLWKQVTYSVKVYVEKSFQNFLICFFLYTLFITNQIQGVFQGWCQNWVFEEFSMAFQQFLKIQEFSRNSRSSRVNPNIKWVKRSNVRVKHLVQEHNAVPQPGCKTRPLLQGPAH